MKPIVLNGFKLRLAMELAAQQAYQRELERQVQPQVMGRVICEEAPVTLVGALPEIAVIAGRVVEYEEG